MLPYSPAILPNKLECKAIATQKSDSLRLTVMSCQLSILRASPILRQKHAVLLAS